MGLHQIEKILCKNEYNQQREETTYRMEKYYKLHIG
jgi:hypothetical protein